MVFNCKCILYLLWKESLNKAGKQFHQVEISLSRKWRVEISLSRKRRVEISLIGLTLPHYCICPKPRSGFPFAYVKIFFVFNDIEAKAQTSY
jgi:hypothetical protein